MIIKPPPSFSTIISIYENDNPQWFYEAFESIVKQEVAPSQIVVSQDGSIPKQLRKVLIELKEKYGNNINIKIVSSKDQMGRGELLRRAVWSCENEMIAIMDADDISHPDRFSKQLKVFAEKEVDVVGSWVNEAEPLSLNVYAIKIVPEKTKSIYCYSKLRNPINQMTVMFRKSAVIEAGNYEHLQYFEDYWLWGRMLKKGYSFYNIQSPLVTARAGNSMYKRRLGLSYAKSEIELYSKLRRISYLSSFEYATALFLRIPLRLIPAKVYGLLLSSSLLRDTDLKSV